jgi:hypothetical protein
MSARTSGSWQQFRAAVEQLHLPDDEDAAANSTADDGVDTGGLPLYQALRLNLQRLGHAEFLPGVRGIEWRISPPSMAIEHQPDGVLGVISGARSVRLLASLSAIAGSRLQTSALPCAPASLSVRAGDVTELENIAKLVGLYVQGDASRALLACLPTVDDPSVRRRTDFPLGVDWRIERFDPRGLLWKQCDRDIASASRFGLFRFSLAYQRLVLLRASNSSFQIPSQVGKFVVAHRRHRRLLRYNSTNLTLRVPAICRPPFLVERALILSSGGRLPTYQSASFGGGLLEYPCISADIARLAAGILRQELSYE